MNRNYLRILESRTAQEKYLIAQNTRADIIGELDAIIQYERHIAEVNDAITKKTLDDIVMEEKLHVGQLFGLLFQVDPEAKNQFEKGINEFLTSSGNYN